MLGKRLDHDPVQASPGCRHPLYPDISRVRTLPLIDNDIQLTIWHSGLFRINLLVCLFAGMKMGIAGLK